MIVVPFIIAGIAGATSYLLLGLFKSEEAPPPGPFSMPAPQPFVPAGDPGESLNPGVLPLDQDGFPRQATQEFLQDNGLQERRDPVFEQRQSEVRPPRPVIVGPAQDNFFDPGSGLNAQNGPPPEELVEVEEPSEVDSFIDSLNPFGDD